MNNSENKDFDPVNFYELADLFITLNVFSSPSELHGMLCGQLAHPDSISEHKWLAGAATFLEQTHFESDETKALLLEMFATTRQQLLSTGFELLMLLPEDDADISTRGESLRRWCLGFVAGIGAACTALTQESKETLEDIKQIAQLDEQSIHNDDTEHEQDLMHLTEYARMAAIMLFSDLQVRTEQTDTDRKQPPFH